MPKMSKAKVEKRINGLEADIHFLRKDIKKLFRRIKGLETQISMKYNRIANLKCLIY